MTQVFKDYQAEFEKDIEIDRLSLTDKQLRLPALKGKWVAKLMNNKADLNTLNEIYDEAIEKTAEKIKNESPIAMSQAACIKAAYTSELPLKIKKQIKIQLIVIEYLEKCEKILSSMSYDISNLISLIKMETM